MRIEELMRNVLNKINEEIQKMMDNPSYSELIGDIIGDELDLNGYSEIVDKYISAIDELLTNGLKVKFNIKNILLVLKYISEIDDDIEITEKYKVCAIKSEILQELYVNNCEIKNIYLERSKNLIISKTYRDFSDYLGQVNGQSYLYILKALFDNFDYNIENGNDRIVFLTNCNENDIEIFKANYKELVSYLKLCILADGKSFHKHYKSENNLVSTIPPCTQQDKNYYQYNEILYILSEYNYSNDLLNKYFLLYTIIENFMYRHPISKMLRNGREFSIRRFKGFYSAIDSNESKKITELISSILKINFGVNTFEDELQNLFKNFFLQNSNKENELINFLIKIGVSDKLGEMSKNMYFDNLNKRFTETIYCLRNSILHNTATEFHITHYELSKNDIVVKFLRELIIPFLEKVILYLIHESHDIISYEQNSLILYEK